MKLLTKQLVDRFQQVGRQEDKSDPVIIAKFFNPTGAGTWYATDTIPVIRLLWICFYLWRLER